MEKTEIESKLRGIIFDHADNLGTSSETDTVKKIMDLFESAYASGITMLESLSPIGDKPGELTPYKLLTDAFPYFQIRLSRSEKFYIVWYINDYTLQHGRGEEHLIPKQLIDHVMNLLSSPPTPAPEKSHGEIKMGENSDIHTKRYVDPILNAAPETKTEDYPPPVCEYCEDQGQFLTTSGWMPCGKCNPTKEEPEATGGPRDWTKEERAIIREAIDCLDIFTSAGLNPGNDINERLASILPTWKRDFKKDWDFKKDLGVANKEGGTEI